LATVRRLKEAGIQVRFYLADRKALGSVPEDMAIHIVSDEKIVAFAAFSQDDRRLEFREDPIPEIEYAEFDTRLKNALSEMERIHKRFKAIAKLRPHLEAYRELLEKNIEFELVKHSVGQEERFVYLQGYCPDEAIGSISQKAEKEGWGIIVEEPDDPDEAPTLIRNPRWIRIIDPLFQFMGTLPGYAEYDISFWFLLFFSVFFAILIGDAGYGLVFLIISILLMFKTKGRAREPVFLLLVLSGTTIIWGLLSGTWFGLEKIAQIPFLNSMIIDQIDSFAESNQTFMMFLCFTIGVIHLSIAHGMRALRVLPSPRALGEVGWIAILWSLFFLAGKLVINRPIPDFMSILFITGTVLTLLFSNFQKNVLKGVMATVGDLPLSIISSFSDIVSYLRLFAVGYASVIVAQSFNDMALGAGIHSVLSGLIAALVLFFGHSLNIVLGVMSVVVHGVRLNMLEFSGHLNMQWAGQHYRPFKD
jgi:V/A-type H+-transporting ATPase subunit I